MWKIDNSTEGVTSFYQLTMNYQISWSKDSSRFQLERNCVFEKNRVEYPNEIGKKNRIQRGTWDTKIWTIWGGGGWKTILES